MRARGDRGATGLEYGLLLAGLAMAAVIGATTLADPVSNAFTCIASKMSDPASAPPQCASGGSVTPPPQGGPVDGGSGTGPGPTTSPTPTATCSPSPDPCPTQSPTDSPSGTPTATTTGTGSPTATPTA